MGVKHRYECPICGGVLAKLTAQYSGGPSTPKHLTTPYHYCIKCEKPMRLEFKVVRMSIAVGEKR